MTEAGAAGGKQATRASESDAVAVVFVNWIRALERENQRLRRRLAEAGYQTQRTSASDYDA
ncbi:MAG: hypothetical protein QM759_08145 [Terricaulis sp.]